MTTPSRLPALLLATITAGAALGLSACAQGEAPEATTDNTAATGAAASGQIDDAADHPDAADGTATGGDAEGTDAPGDRDGTEDQDGKSGEKTSARSSEDAKSKKDKTDSADDQLAQARKEFAGLVPEELFERFDSCTPNGLEDSLECSGREVGQFQFFKSDTKAASTTQVLTELRSSRVVEDRNDRVVGWSTLGNTAILSVVDNERGLVVQQMVSTDQVDPKKRIFELGLAEQHKDAQGHKGED